MLLRIYRHDTFSIGVKIPALGSIKDERQAEYFKGLYGVNPVRGDFSRSQTSTGMFNVLNANSTLQRTGNTTTTTQSAWVGPMGFQTENIVTSQGQGRRTSNSIQTSHATGVDSAGNETYGQRDKTHGKAYRNRKNPLPPTIQEQIKERLKRASGFEFVLARNGREVTLEQLISDGKKYKAAYDKYKNSNSTSAIEYIKKSVEDFTRKITDIKDLINKVPQARPDSLSERVGPRSPRVPGTCA
jgi:hypothetical protein